MSDEQQVGDEYYGPIPECTCGGEVKHFFVRKDGPNYGKEFFSCQGCGSFMWKHFWKGGPMKQKVNSGNHNDGERKQPPKEHYAKNPNPPPTPLNNMAISELKKEVLELKELLYKVLAILEAV